MTTVVGLSARYANFLVHPLLPGPGVCQVCRGPAKAGCPTCWPCSEAGRILGTGVADAVAPVSLALKGEQYANELWRFVAMHEECIAAHCAVPGFDTVTTVPSTSGRHDHPLRTLVADMVGVTRDRYRELLTPTPAAAALGRVASPARYTSSAIWGENILLIDDTWTTGSHAQSASAALKAAGAGSVAVVVLGRHLNSDYGDTATHVQQARLRRFSWGACPMRPWNHC
ncbi:hypothetical protein GT028_04180 [Streptomyces sp. SID2999]|nr:hypothetical protein [Streptomyces sp. SID2999]